MNASNEKQADEMTLSEALKILEVTDINGLSESDIPRIRKRAMRRWHPDRIAHTRPSPELLAEYEENFKKIDPALEQLSAFLGGDLGSSINRRKRASEQTIQPEEAVRKYAAANQESVADLWREVKEKSFERTEEEIVLTEGIPLSAALDEDLKDRVPALAVFSFGAGFLIMVLALIAVVIVGVFNNTIGEILGWIVLVAWGLHALACIIFLLPLSRFWLPPQISDAIINVVNATLNITRGWVDDEEGFGKFAHAALSLVAGLFHWLIALPIYKLAGLAAGSRMIGRNVINVEYFGGFAGDYVEHLISKPTESMSLDELFDLSAMVSTYSQVRS